MSRHRRGVYIPLQRLGFLLLFASAAPLIGQPITLMGLGYTGVVTNSLPQITVAPGQIVTVMVSNSKTVFPQGGSFPTDLRAASLPLPTSLHGFSVTIRDIGGDHLAPLIAVGQGLLCEFDRSSSDCRGTAIQLQVPFDMGWSNDPPSIVEMIVNDNGTQSKPFMLAPRPDNIHILTTCEIKGGALSNGIWAAFPPCTALVQHQDGSLVSSFSPARPGEVVVIYAYGLGTTFPAVPSGQAAPTPAPVLGNQYTGPRTVNIGFDYRPNAMPSHPYVPASQSIPAPEFVGLTPGQVGLYQINVRVPNPLPPIVLCTGPGAPLQSEASYVQTNLTIDIGGIYSFDGAAICVSPPQSEFSPSVTRGDGEGPYGRLTQSFSTPAIWAAPEEILAMHAIAVDETGNADFAGGT